MFLMNDKIVFWHFAQIFENGGFGIDVRRLDKLLTTDVKYAFMDKNLLKTLSTVVFSYKRGNLISPLGF